MTVSVTEPVTVSAREEWFRGFNPAHRPLWVYEHEGSIAGWTGLRSYYGRPAYQRTVESSVYVDPGHRRRGIAHELLDNAIREAPAKGIANILAFVFVHNQPSVTLFAIGLAYTIAGPAEWLWRWFTRRPLEEIHEPLAQETAQG